MTAKPFHLGWFLNFVTDDWRGTWGDGGEDWSGGFFVEMARDLERACFDYMMIEDKVMVSTSYGGTMEAVLKHGISPKHDPVPLAVLVAQATTRLGVIATMSTSFYPPYLLARLCATVDHIAQGRYGWNIVTSGEDLAAQNFGMDKLYDHDERYDMATEYVDLVCKLWDSWEPDAVVRDRGTGVYVDHNKVHAIDFAGKYYKSRGPLNTVRPPRGRPVLCQAGASPKGREFAARYSDTIIAGAENVAQMKSLRDDIRTRMERVGRRPDDCKVLFLASPFLGETEEEAREKKRRMMTDPYFIEFILAETSNITDIDFSQFDLDKPLPDLSTNAERSFLERFVRIGRGRPLREVVADGGMGGGGVELVGTPDQVAVRMGEVMEEVGGDGFLLKIPTMKLNRRYVTEVTDGLVPALQRRGLTRREYSSPYLLDNLLEF